MNSSRERIERAKQHLDTKYDELYHAIRDDGCDDSQLSRCVSEVNEAEKEVDKELRAWVRDAKSLQKDDSVSPIRQKAIQKLVAYREAEVARLRRADSSSLLDDEKEEATSRAPIFLCSLYAGDAVVRTEQGMLSRADGTEDEIATLSDFNLLVDYYANARIVFPRTSQELTDLRSNLHHCFTQMPQERHSPNQTILFYFAGHGDDAEEPPNTAFYELLRGLNVQQPVLDMAWKLLNTFEHKGYVGSGWCWSLGQIAQKGSTNITTKFYLSCEALIAYWIAWSIYHKRIQDTLIIVADCCGAGNWKDDLTKLMDVFDTENEEEEEGEDIYVDCERKSYSWNDVAYLSSHMRIVFQGAVEERGDRAMGGLFTPKWLGLQKATLSEVGTYVKDTMETFNSTDRIPLFWCSSGVDVRTANCVRDFECFRFFAND